MKLSTAILRWRDKGLTKEEALVKAKDGVRAAGSKWTKASQTLFDLTWVRKSDVPRTSTPKLPKDSDQDKGQGGTIEQRIKFFQTLLKVCKFEVKAWSKYGLHVIRPGSEKRPANIKTAIDLLVKEGFAQNHRSAMSPEFADRNSQRAVTMYSDRYGNSANTVSQKSDNGKSDFYILNVTPKLTAEDRGRLNEFEQQLLNRTKEVTDKAAQGKIKQKPHNNVYEQTFSEFTKRLKGSYAVRGAQPSTLDFKEQWVTAIEAALKEGIRLRPEIVSEYTAMIKSTGGVYKLPTGRTSYLPITLETRKLKSIKRNLLAGTDVVVKSDSGVKFTLTTVGDETWHKCGSDFSKALGIKEVFASKV